MSEDNGFEVNEGFDSMGVLPEQGNQKGDVVSPYVPGHLVDESESSHSYSRDEAPPEHLMDPSAFLPLNSDRLIGSVNIIEKLFSEIGTLVEEEVLSIQKYQKRITSWEERIEQNKSEIKKNEFQIKENNGKHLRHKKNRNYWSDLSEDVEVDYSRASAANCPQDWSWLIKKYGLKGVDTSPIDFQSECVDELCNGEISNLSAKYRAAAKKCEESRAETEAEINRLFRLNVELATTNETLQGYISSTYTNEIEPLQDGILLFKDLGVKLKSMSENEKITYGDLRGWAEGFLSEFIKVNSRVPQPAVTHFRRLTSIPLPPENC